MIQAIFFDFNGVIIDDERLQMEAYREVLSIHSIDLTEADYFAALGMDDKTFVRAAFARADQELTDEVLSSVLAGKGERHRKLIEDELPLFHGVVTFLKAAARSYPLGVVSMAGLNEIDYVLERAKLGTLFTVVVSAEDVTVCKPAPDCYRMALEKLNEKRQGEGKGLLSSRECLVVEDSPPGIESATQAGMRTLGLTNSMNEAALRAAGAEVVTHSLADWNLDAVRHVFS
ncbi:MAG: HAD family hydrolase [Pyrinomonadaceae bacterium]